MNWIFPIGGKGTRTQALGEFKPFIQIKGHRMLKWHLYSIKKNLMLDDKLIFVTTDYFAKKFRVKPKIGNILEELEIPNKFYVFSTEGFVAGSSLAIYSAKTLLNTDEPVNIVNCDQFTDFQMPREIAAKSIYLTLIVDFGDKRGYIEVKDKKITRFEEKNGISNLAHSGVTLVSNGKDLIRALEKQFEDNLITKGEFCPGPALNYLLDDGYEYHPLRVFSYYDLGNLADIEYFTNTLIAENLSEIMKKKMPQTLSLSSSREDKLEFTGLGSFFNSFNFHMNSLALERALASLTK